MAEKCTSLGAQETLYIVADMSSEQDPEKVVEFALEKLGGLDYLVLNHIRASQVKMWDGDLEYFERMMKVMQHFRPSVSTYIVLLYLLCLCVCLHRSIYSAMFR